MYYERPRVNNLEVASECCFWLREDDYF